jgi:hypothetical protein
VPFARYGARFTRDFEDTVAVLATETAVSMDMSRGYAASVARAAD